MNLEIHGLTECLFLDIILLWAFVCLCILGVLMMLGTLFVDNGLLSINDNNIIDKILKLKNDDRHIYKFTKKLSKDNISFLSSYKMLKLDRVILKSNFNQETKQVFINENEKRLYKKIESIFYYYNLINQNK